MTNGPQLASSLLDDNELVVYKTRNHLWKVYNARKGAKVSALFVFDKTKCRLAKEDVASKVVPILKRDAATLARLRHPSLLEVSEPFDDAAGACAFATEPLLCCLANLLGDFRNFDVTSVAEWRAKMELDEVEIQKGILQVIKGLEFLHANKWTHLSLSPSAIFINARGDWKIGAFAFAQSSSVGDSAFYLGDFAPFCAPVIDFMAPELVLDSRCRVESDGETEAMS
ncbi:hypothetical protein BC830DRAFT_1084141 [Chytriomyces sp. MP71]|nr:hypothetical protein BC830DRAFT_1084141 [Chytriomyces sp. MP71]